MGKNVVIELGKDWWKQSRSGSAAGATKIELKRPLRSARNTDFLTVTEVSEKLRRAYGWVLDRIHAGDIEAQPMPRGYLIPVEAVDDYLARLRATKKTG